MNEIFLMIEFFNQGQENTNILIRSLGLDEIKDRGKIFKKNNLEMNYKSDLISKSSPLEIRELAPIKSWK